MINRDNILGEAMHECLVAMYKWSQPSIDLNELIKSGFKDNRENPLYEQHYLSQENFEYIRQAYMDAYGITDDWDDTFEILIKQLKEGGIEDDYKPATKERPGYRDYKKVAPLAEVITCPGELNTIIDYIQKCQNFFKGHRREKDQFSCSVALGGSPTTCAKKVEEYWHNNGRPDFVIKDYKIEDIIWGSEENNYEPPTEEEFINSLKQHVCSKERRK